MFISIPTVMERVRRSEQEAEGKGTQSGEMKRRHLDGIFVGERNCT